jgi:hypothetical protein
MQRSARLRLIPSGVLMRRDNADITLRGGKHSQRAATIRGSYHRDDNEREPLAHHGEN